MKLAGFFQDVWARLWDDYREWQFVKSVAGAGSICRGALVLKDTWCELTLLEDARIEAGTILYCRNQEANPLPENLFIRIGQNSFVGYYCNLRTSGGGALRLAIMFCLPSL
jgi:hypothetical protein